MSLLESAVAAGIVSPKSAVPCMAEILGAHSQADFVVFGRSVN
jgi:hypothetical protein